MSDLRDAATVVLIRPCLTRWADVSAGSAVPAPAAEHAGDLQVLLMRRSAHLSFGAGAHVFPGGTLDPSDADPDLPWWGEPVSGFGPGEAERALVATAVRETFEECGVLLALNPDGSQAVLDPADASWETDRAALASGHLSLSELLRRRGLALTAQMLKPWSRWITPVSMPKRYDTRFFVAVLPQGQQAGNRSAESDHTLWIEPQAALQASQVRGEDRMLLMPPTRISLQQLVAAGSLESVLAAQPALEPITPVLPPGADLDLPGAPASPQGAQ